MRALYKKVNFFTDEELDREIPRDMADFHAVITVYLKDGTSYHIHALYPVLTFDEVKFKFDCNVDDIIGKERAEQIVSTIQSLEQLSDGEALYRAIS